MDLKNIKICISEDVAKIQHNSDILSQWPISSVEAMYYSGPFFMKLLAESVLGSGDSADDLFKNGFYPGKLSNLIFFFLNEKVKEIMGAENYSNLLNLIISKISILREDDLSLRKNSSTIMPHWLIENDTDEVSARRTVFLLDNLVEMVNPIFRSFGVQLFFDKKYAYRYYYRTGLDFNVVIKSPKEGMAVDYFEHVISPENLDSSKVYKETNGKLSGMDTDDLNQKLVEKVGDIKGLNTFDRKYVIQQIYDSFGLKIPNEQLMFLSSPFPEIVKEMYIKTCLIPIEYLEKGILNLIK